MQRDWSEALLDLLNTTPVIDGTPTEALDGAWLRANGAAGHRVHDARGVRDDLQRVVRGEVSGDVLDTYLRGVTQTPQIVGDAVTWRLDADWPARMVLAWGNCSPPCRAGYGRARTANVTSSCSTAAAVAPVGGAP